MGAYNKQYKQQRWRCEKYDHKPGNQRCPENKNKKEENLTQNHFQLWTLFSMGNN